MSDFPTPERGNFYGRIHGKTMRPQQKADLADLLPLYEFSGLPTGEIWLEIGFGGGEHLHHLAGEHPQIQFIGCEIFVNGVAMLLGKLRAEPRDNLKLFTRDVRDLFAKLPDQSVSRAYLNYPDPWPKARHHRRRFVTPEYLAALHRVMKPGAELRMASDIPDYIRQTHEEVPGQGFRLTYESGEPYPGWTRTRYEAKAVREGRVPHYMIWERV